MKKYDASLIEVWDWKDKVYQEIKDMSVRDQILKISHDANRILSEGQIELKSLSREKTEYLA